MDGTKVGVFEQSNQISFCSLLQGHNCCALESDFAAQRRGDYFAVSCNFPHQSLKGQLPYQKLCALLVLPDLLQGNSSRPISITLLHSAFWSFLAAFLCHPSCCLLALFLLLLCQYPPQFLLSFSYRLCTRLFRLESLLSTSARFGLPTNCFSWSRG